MATGKRRANAGSFAKGQSGNPSGKAKRADAHWSEIVANAARSDGWMNDLTGMGVIGRDKTMGSSTNVDFTPDLVTPDVAVGYWRGDAIAARIIETVPNEALREGWELCIGEDDTPDRFVPPKPEDTAPAPPGPGQQAARGGAPQLAKRQTTDGRTRFTRMDAARARQRRRDESDGSSKELQEAVTKRLTDLGALAAIREAMHYERAYGGGALLLGANDYTTDLREPLDLQRVKSLDWITPLEPRELIPRYWYTNARAPKFGQPAVYQLMPMLTGPTVERDYVPQMCEVHESRLIIFPGIRATRRIVAAGTYGWGDSVLTRIVTSLKAYRSGNQSAAALLADFAQTIYKIKNLAELIAADGPGALMAKVQSIELVRSILRALVVDADGEDVERKSTTLTGLPETIASLTQQLAADADMPLTLLMGQSPAGLNATGASDIRFFYDRIGGVQRWRVAPALMRLVEIELWANGQDPAQINHSVEFKSLWQPTELELAQRNLTQAQADALYVTNGVASPEEIALSRFGGDSYSLSTHVDFDARADMEAVAAPPVDADPEPPPIIMAGVNAAQLGEGGAMPAGAAKATGAAPVEGGE